MALKIPNVAPPLSRLFCFELPAHPRSGDQAALGTHSMEDSGLIAMITNERPYKNPSIPFGAKNINTKPSMIIDAIDESRTRHPSYYEIKPFIQKRERLFR